MGPNYDDSAYLAPSTQLGQSVSPSGEFPYQKVSTKYLADTHIKSSASALV